MNHKQAAHEFMLQFLNTQSRVVDMTCGNGHDTLFLAHHAQHVYAIDIQKAAIEATEILTQDYANITFLNQSHDTVDYKKIAPITGAIYNLGYLPGSDKTLITTAATTIASLKKLLDVVSDFIVVSCYLKHEGGYDEYQAVTAFLDATNTSYETLRYETPLSPVTYLIDLRNMTR
ncbi:methyltransferase domain-containing protein [Erysipelothrix sp. HDW6C]|uniref:class I SAM-dependent methyltransferase n=1 Tax=Erysipelothrix sp. HDW6C TaxID=2714930 RepID=UPI00140D1B3F|nr:class I SAM-dependent methyltransferase [Erysipelothrix sp. HDW6C]QIK70326.1 methyltransferase domain-containing protein [Erysipelothrix sp. HDW6C]